MTQRITKRQIAKSQERFKSALTEYILRKGARPGRYYDYELDTPAGLLHITIYEKWIATRFANVALGREFTAKYGNPSNPFTGKWNFHFYDGTPLSIDPNRAIADFGFYIEILMNWKPARF